MDAARIKGYCKTLARLCDEYKEANDKKSSYGVLKKMNTTILKISKEYSR